MKLNDRKNIYYWKSDRQHTQGNTQDLNRSDILKLQEQLKEYLTAHFKTGLLKLSPAGGQGNHITLLAMYIDQTYFVRVENGPEKDDYMDIESAVLQKINHSGIPSPKLFHSDSSRQNVPFAIQVIEYIKSSDLNILEKKGELELIKIAMDIGKYIAKWQQITFPKFGLLNPLALSEKNILEGYHDTYRDYFLLNWDMHLQYLQDSFFLEKTQVREIKQLVAGADYLLDISQGCLVHKDLALWNILGSPVQIHAFIDWSDTISGDDMDDISLLGCFHSGQVVASALEGYSSVKPLPGMYEKKFWLHLLRNIVFKAVIRVKGDYFNKSGNFFMNGTREKDLKTFTLERIQCACQGLMGNKKITDL